MTVVHLHVPDAPECEGLIFQSNGRIAACLHNAVVLLAKEPRYDELHLDEFLSRIRLGDRDWADEDELDALRWLQREHDAPRFTTGQAREACRTLAHSRRRDSLREFVESLPPWDGVPRIATAFTSAWGAADAPFVRAASQNFFIALVARALRPGAQVDTCWCFEAPQGIGKSRALRALGQELHAEISAGIGTTDFMRELRGVWIAELSELDSLRGREASTVKRLLSVPADRFVEKYQTHARNYPRRAVAVATTNESDYWQDHTGARRLVPIRCGVIDVEHIATTRLQWFAEARNAYEAGASWWDFPAHEIAAAQEERQDRDPWEDVLRDYMEHGKPAASVDGAGRVPWPKGWISTAEIMSTWLGLSPAHQGRPSGKRLAAVMHRLGYEPRRSTTGRERGWSPPR